MRTTRLNKQDIFPLTCSRSGACCHGNRVLLNPWELFCLANEKKMPPREFRDLYGEFGGIRLRFDGKLGWGNKHACSQYVDNTGCSVYLGRPLACRLFPLGRQIQNNEVHFIYQGDEFPCLKTCAEVLELPHLSVEEYLKRQITDLFEKAQDAYLEMMQDIADIAFELLLETGLTQSGEKKTLKLWRKMGNESPELLADRIGSEWIDYLMIPEISADREDPISFVRKHHELLQIKAQEKFGALHTNQEFHEASVLILGVALHLARGIGADTETLADHWIHIARNNGAKE